MYIAALPSCFSSRLSTVRLFQAFIGKAERFFCSVNHFCFYAEHVSVLSSIFRQCLALSGSTKHFSSILNGLSALLSIFFYAECFFCSAKHVSAMLSPFLLCQALFFHAMQYTAEQKNTRQSRKKKK